MIPEMEKVLIFLVICITKLQKSCKEKVYQSWNFVSEGFKEKNTSPSIHSIQSDAFYINFGTGK